MAKKNSSAVRSGIKPIIITLIILIPVLFLLMILFFWMLDGMLLHESLTFMQSFHSHYREVLVITVCIWALAFYYITGSFKVKEPSKTETLANGRWRTIEEQKKEFAVCPINTNQTISVGGAPCNKISDSQLLYNKASMHDLTIGMTRSGKSRKIVRQLVMIASMAGESMIFNDPKKEMYQDFHKYLRNKEYDVYCLDFRNLEYSNAWNPFEDIIYAFENGNIEDADQYAEDQVTSLVVDNGKTEPIWIDGQKALIKTAILEVAQAPIKKEKKNFYSVFQMIYQLAREIKIDGQEKMPLSAYVDTLDETSPSRASFAPIYVSKDKTRSSFVSSTLATLHPFTSMKLMKILGHSDFNFRDFKNGKKALFVVKPDEKKTYDAIAAMVYDNAYQTLVFEASKISGMKLKKRVHMIFDEFGNMPKLSNIKEKITVSLSRDIIFHLYVQDFDMMNDVYGDNLSKIIRSNCGLWYFISSSDFQACKDMSDKLGQETIWVQSQGGNFNEKSDTTGGNIGYSQQTKPLMSPNELLESDMRDGHGIILYCAYLGPCKVELPDCSDYAWYDKMEHDKTEVKNEDLKLEYAIPRYVVLNREVFKKYGIEYPPAPDEVLSTKPSLKSKDMYWYWSTRDDLNTLVVQKVVDEMKATNSTPLNFNIREYMKSKPFIKWLWDIDIPKDSSEKEVKKVDKAMNQMKEQSYDNQFADSFMG